MYDDVNRLAMASENAAITGSSCPLGATWCRQYGYDHFGNRWIAASLDTLHSATPTSGSAIDLDTNRLTAGTYDAAGNLTAHPYITTGSGSMTYNANNKMTSFTATGVSVTTDYAGGARMRKVFNSETTIWVYDAMGRLAAEYRNGSGPGLSASTPDKEFVYRGGNLAAMIEDSEIYYRTTDHLGSSRVVTDSIGNVVKRQDFFPFGETIPASSSYGGRNNVTDDSVNTYNASSAMKQQFTGQQRDEETDVDYFWERCMIPVLARFLSVDPENAAASVENPGNWNGYSYGANNPLRFVDPDGRDPGDVFGSFSANNPGNYNDYEGFLVVGGGYFEFLYEFADKYFFDVNQSVTLKFQPNGIASARGAVRNLTGFNPDELSDCGKALKGIITQQNRRLNRFSRFGEQVRPPSYQSVLQAIRDTARSILNDPGSISHGPGSNVALDARSFPGAGSGGSATVGQWFDQPGYNHALSQINGNAIYIDERSWINPSAGFVTDAKDGFNATAYGKGLMLHEVMHKASVGAFGGPDHSDFRGPLGIDDAAQRLSKDDLIAVTLGRLCFQ